MNYVIFGVSLIGLFIFILRIVDSKKSLKKTIYNHIGILFCMSFIILTLTKNEINYNNSHEKEIKKLYSYCNR